ncbi:flagellar export protein FliJ [uncultured Pseudodesulfovibrio sp.]|uniref:flagellar export protein FliJ n=1 Tax=uncultured Pseudodesulfovibrio sp. TaxID=2035858 RepID=UPI0029C92294|nr:flagellar export protein FliJ [uncultured Pseudodesulfovibrio sp.]
MSRKFSFQLDKVLDYREQLEEQAKGALARARAARDVQAVKVADLEDALREHMLKEKVSQKSTNDMWLWRQYKEALGQDISVARMNLNSLELKLQRCRAEAVERSKDKKLLEKLKATQAKKHHEEENARQEKENDEMATLRYESKNF